MKKKGRFDYILLETTGLADPGMSIFPLTEGCILIYWTFGFYTTGPIASLFWLDSELCSDIHLDGNYTSTSLFRISHKKNQ
jgi:G3E family GTPase